MSASSGDRLWRLTASSRGALLEQSGGPRTRCHVCEADHLVRQRQLRDPHIDVYGIYGPCDRYGYGISDVGAGWAARISSFEVYGSCFYTDVWDQTDYRGDWTVYSGDVPWVGSVWNDRIRSMHTSA